MLRFAIVAALCATAAAVGILNSFDPHLVAILRLPVGYGPAALACSGVIVSPNYILTAASCLPDANGNDIVIRAGSQYYELGGELLYAEEVFVHPQYDGDDYDLALISLREPLRFSHRLQAAQLPSDDAQIIGDNEIYFSGWGRIQKYARPSGYMKVTNLTPLPPHLCLPQDVDPIYPMTKNMGCAKFKQHSNYVCIEDMGAPISSGGVVYGIASNYYDCGTNNPALYTRTAPFKEWVDRFINQRK